MGASRGGPAQRGLWDDQGKVCLTLRFSTRVDRDATIREITVALSRATAIVKAS